MSLDSFERYMTAILITGCLQSSKGHREDDHQNEAFTEFVESSKTEFTLGTKLYLLRRRAHQTSQAIPSHYPPVLSEGNLSKDFAA